MFKSKASRAAERAANASLAKQQFRQDYFGECHRTYSCIHCRAHLANHDELISKLFQGNHGRAYLFNKVVNVGCKQAVQRELLTGLHAVADIYCDSCETTLGWKYEQAFVPSQKYKEGKYIIELVHMLKENNWDLTSYNARQLLDEAGATLGTSVRLEAAAQAPTRTFYHKQYNQVNQMNPTQNENHQRSSGAEEERRGEQPGMKQRAKQLRAPNPPNKQQQAPRQSAPTVISDATIGQELVELIERSSKAELASRRTKSLPKETGDWLGHSCSQDSSLVAPASPEGSLCSSSSSSSVSPLSSSSGSSAAASSCCLASEVGGEHIGAPEQANSAGEPLAAAISDDKRLNSACEKPAVVVVVPGESNGSYTNSESNGLSAGDHKVTSSAV